MTFWSAPGTRELPSGNSVDSPTEPCEGGCLGCCNLGVWAPSQEVDWPWHLTDETTQYRRQLLLQVWVLKANNSLAQGKVIFGGKQILSDTVGLDFKAKIWRGHWTMRYSTWNIRSFLGKEVELVNEIKKLDLHVVAIREKEERRRIWGYSFFYSGVLRTEKAQAGVAFSYKETT